MSDPGPSFREKCLLASRLVFQDTYQHQYSAAVVFACAQLMSLADMCCKLRVDNHACTMRAGDYSFFGTHSVILFRLNIFCIH
eukprot:COSAG05_NODE_1172_length_5623_cov_3.561188_8_plen_83_part_00